MSSLPVGSWKYAWYHKRSVGLRSTCFKVKEALGGRGGIAPTNSRPRH
jgi:hypothetical protein